MTVATLKNKIKELDADQVNSLYVFLVGRFPPINIPTKKLHKEYLELLDLLMSALEDPKTTDSDRRGINLYISIVSPKIEEFERAHFEKTPASVADVLQYLMEQNELSQNDLSKELGGQSIVSEILRGKRTLNTRQIERLARRFHVSPATFFPV